MVSTYARKHMPLFSNCETPLWVSFHSLPWLTSLLHTALRPLQKGLLLCTKSSLVGTIAQGINFFSYVPYAQATWEVFGCCLLLEGR